MLVVPRRVALPPPPPIDRRASRGRRIAFMCGANILEQSNVIMALIAKMTRRQRRALHHRFTAVLPCRAALLRWPAAAQRLAARHILRAIAHALRRRVPDRWPCNL